MNKRTQLALVALTILAIAPAVQAATYVIGENFCQNMAQTVAGAQRDYKAGVDYEEVMDDLRDPERLEDPKNAAAMPIVSRLVGDLYDGNLNIPEGKLIAQVGDMCRQQIGRTVEY